MIGIAGALAAIVVFLILALYRQQITHLNHLNDTWVKAAAERKSLLDRIQHPEVRQVDPIPQVEYVPPQDAGELAKVGTWDGEPFDMEAPMPDLTEMLSGRLGG